MRGRRLETAATAGRRLGRPRPLPRPTSRRLGMWLSPWCLLRVRRLRLGLGITVDPVFISGSLPVAVLAGSRAPLPVLPCFRALCPETVSSPHVLLLICALAITALPCIAHALVIHTRQTCEGRRGPRDTAGLRLAPGPPSSSRVHRYPCNSVCDGVHASRPFLSWHDARPAPPSTMLSAAPATTVPNSPPIEPVQPTPAAPRTPAPVAEEEGCCGTCSIL